MPPATNNKKATLISYLSGMKNNIGEILKNNRMNFATYGGLPIREDVLVFVPETKEMREARAMVKLYEKLEYMRRHLQIVDKYIRRNKGESMREWLKANNRGLSKKVLDEIGDHNNKTGGISAYFFNLQNYYDGEEAAYDAMEARAKIPAEIEVAIANLRKEREEKRKNRRATRKILTKKLKADGKGYIEVSYGEEAEPKADAPKKHPEEKPAPETNAREADGESSAPQVDETVEKTMSKAKKITVVFAGFAIAIGIGIAIASATSEK